MAETLTVRLGPVAVRAFAVERALGSLGYQAHRVGGILDTSGAGVADSDPPTGCCMHFEQEGAHPDSQRPAAAPVIGHAHPHGDEEGEATGTAWWRIGKACLVWLLDALIVAAYVAARPFPAFTYPLFLTAALGALCPFGRRALALARAGAPFSSETLMCVAALGAVIIGAAEEAAIVVLLFAVGELLENLAVGEHELASGRFRRPWQCRARPQPASARH